MSGCRLRGCNFSGGQAGGEVHAYVSQWLSIAGVPRQNLRAVEMLPTSTDVNASGARLAVGELIVVDWLEAWPGGTNRSKQAPYRQDGLRWLDRFVGDAGSRPIGF